MRLSEALMLGSTLGEKPSNEKGWNGCLLGISCHALGEHNWGNSEAERRWPWLLRPISVAGRFYALGRYLLNDLCAKVDHQGMSIQQAAEIVRSVEPAELEVGEVQNEQTDGRQVPIPKLCLEEIEV